MSNVSTLARSTRHAATRSAHRVGATVEAIGDGYAIIAPQGHNWSAIGTHEILALDEQDPEFDATDQPLPYRSVVWRSVIDEIKQGVEPCDSNCEYWG